MSYIVILMSFTAIFPSIGYGPTNMDSVLFPLTLSLSLLTYQDETIDIIINKCFASATHYAISRDQFRDLLNLSFLWQIATYNLYKQVDGVAMGSPLGPLFANIFLSFREK
jgi:hypothetical protein